MRLVVLGFVTGGLAIAGVSGVYAAGEGAPVTQQKSFAAGKVVVDGFYGTLTITTAAAGAPVTVRATGKPEIMKRLDIRQDANGVLIRMESQSKTTWWPWSALDWSHERADDVALTIGAPKGTEFDMDDVFGRVSAGDLDAPLRFGGAGGGTAKFGNVTRARIEVAGSMDVALGNSQGPVDIEIAGSGTARMGSATKARLEIAGSGEFFVGAISGGLDAQVSGAGDATIESVNGPVSLDLSGSSKVVIKAGRADPFKVEISGSGDVDFGGEAVNPDVSISGSGSVAVASMSGSLKQDISGSGEFVVRTPAAPKPPAAPVPPTPPAAPTPPPPPQ